MSDLVKTFFAISYSLRISSRQASTTVWWALPWKINTITQPKKKKKLSFTCQTILYKNWKFLIWFYRFCTQHNGCWWKMCQPQWKYGTRDLEKLVKTSHLIASNWQEIWLKIKKKKKKKHLKCWKVTSGQSFTRQNRSYYSLVLTHLESTN